MGKRGSMDIDVFDAFHLSDYVFLEISRGGVAGNTITSHTNAEGVFKLRSGMVVANDQETRQSDATLHVRPSESFIEAHNGSLIGHGIRCQGKDYAITGQPGGQNYDDGTLEHYRLTLSATDFSDYGESS